MSHPFWKQFAEGGEGGEGLRRFALQYYLHVLQTRLYDAMVLSRTPNEKIQASLASILWDEYGRGDLKKTHPAQFRLLLSALKLKKAEWGKTEPIPELKIYRDTHFHICQTYPFLVGLGVVGLAMEIPIPPLYAHLVTGFRRFGLNDEALEFFLDHMPTDVEHAALMESALAPELREKAAQDQVREGVLRSLDARFHLMTGLERITFGEVEVNVGGGSYKPSFRKN